MRTEKATRPAGAEALSQRPMRTAVRLLPPASFDRGTHTETSSLDLAALTVTRPRSRSPRWRAASLTAPLSVDCEAGVVPGCGVGVVPGAGVGVVPAVD